MAAISPYTAAVAAGTFSADPSSFPSPLPSRDRKGPDVSGRPPPPPFHEGPLRHWPLPPSPGSRGRPRRLYVVVRCVRVCPPQGKKSFMLGEQVPLNSR